MKTKNKVKATKAAKVNNITKSVNVEPKKETNIHGVLYAVLVLFLLVLAIVVRVNGNDADAYWYVSWAMLINFLYWMSRALQAEKKLEELEKAKEGEPVAVETKEEEEKKEEKKKPYDPKNGLVLAIIFFVVSVVLIAYLFGFYYSSDFGFIIFGTEDKVTLWLGFILAGLFFFLSVFFGVEYVSEINPRFRAKLPKKWQEEIEKTLHPEPKNQ